MKAPLKTLHTWNFTEEEEKNKLRMDGGKYGGNGYRRQEVDNGTASVISSSQC